MLKDGFLQAYLLVKLESVQADQSLPHGLLKSAHDMWLKSATHVRVSFLHRDVSRVLTSMGYEHFIEHLTEDRLFSMDISLASATLCNLLPCISKDFESIESSISLSSLAAAY